MLLSFSLDAISARSLGNRRLLLVELDCAEKRVVLKVVANEILSDPLVKSHSTRSPLFADSFTDHHKLSSVHSMFHLARERRVDKRS